MRDDKILEDLKRWLARLDQDRKHRSAEPIQGEINLLNRAIAEIERLRRVA
jgi:hypothetical protein